MKQTYDELKIHYRQLLDPVAGMLNALRGTHAAQAAITEAIDFLSEALGTRA